MREFLSKPVVKNTLMAVLVLVIGGLCSALGGWDYKNDGSFRLKIVLLIISGMSYVGLLIYYSFAESSFVKLNGDLERANNQLEKQRGVYEDIMSGEISICKQSATEVTKALHEIESKGKADLNIWSFDKASSWVCNEIYRLLCKLHGESRDFGVSYIRLDEETGKIYMSGFANQNMQMPTIFGIKRLVEDGNSYHDADLFKKSKADIKVLKNKDEIGNAFLFGKAANRDKYSQYIAIPIFCADRKMIGLLEITCLNETYLAVSERELKEIASKYFVPYTFLILLLHKLEKALLAMPQTTDADERK